MGMMDEHERGIGYFHLAQQAVSIHLALVEAIAALKLVRNLPAEADDLEALEIQETPERDTLRCFGQYYEDVVATPDGDDHGNIRNFMKCGWKGVSFPAGLALQPKGAYEYEPAQETY